MASRVYETPGDDFVETLRHDTYPAIKPTQWSLHGTVVLVTGASRGIGNGIALSYARAGASGIVIAARSSKDLADVEVAVHAAAKDAGRPQPRVLRLVVDIVDNNTVTAAAKAVEDTFGRLDIIVNNAGYVERLNMIADSDPADWWKTIEVNLRGSYLVSRAFLPLLMRSEGGPKTILSVTSGSAHRVDPITSAYSISKLALIRLAEFIAAEYSDKGVTSIVVHPGIVQTNMVDRVADFITHERFETRELTSDTIVWLTKEPRGWLNGRYVNCLWDVEELEAKKAEIVEGDKLKVKLAV